PEKDLLEACVSQIVGTGELRGDDYGETAGESFSRVMRKKVEALVEKRVEAALGGIVDEV
ncbi:unnamed protein product, partial [marine sediment metagenome]